VNTGILTGDRDMPGVGIRPMAERGAGTVQIELTYEGRAIFGDLSGPIDVAFSGGPIFLGSRRADLPPFVPFLQLSAMSRPVIVGRSPGRRQARE
jgi:hypothetical protein